MNRRDFVSMLGAVVAVGSPSRLPARPPFRSAFRLPPSRALVLGHGTAGSLMLFHESRLPALKPPLWPWRAASRRGRLGSMSATTLRDEPSRREVGDEGGW